VLTSKRGYSAAVATRVTEDPDKAKDRLVTWRATLLSGCVVLLAGFVGAGASYMVADKQIDSQSAQSQAEFMRGERRTAYGTLLNDSDAYREAAATFRTEFLSEELAADEASELHSQLDSFTT